MKVCPGCKIEKEPGEYSKDSSRRDGLQSYCKKCRSDHQKTPAGRASQAKYSQTQEFIESQERYRKTPGGRIATRRSVGKYNKTSKGRAARRRRATMPKAIESMQRYNDSPAGRSSRRRYGLRRYKLTPESFDCLLESQGGRCAVCGTDKPGGRGTFHVDHDHSCCPGARSCGKCIRGLLCTNCNRGIGHLKDDPELLRKAAGYVERRFYLAGVR